MRTQISSASIDCYHSHQIEFSHQEQRIMDFIKRHPTKAFTRREIAKAVGLEVSTTAGRVNALIHEKNALEELPRRKCSISGVSSHTVMLKVSGAAQVEMFVEVA